MFLVKGNSVIAIADIISFGVFDESIEKWKLENKDGSLMYYFIDDNFTLVEDVKIPDDYEHGKYFYENGNFVLNAEWKPYISPEQRIKNLETDVAEQQVSTALFEEELLNTQIALTEQYETNIALEEELLGTQLALTEQYETNIILEEELNSTKEELDSAQNEIVELQLAICELYESMA